jgi:transaldolase/glucose-6-phosphate isomerase
MNALKELQKYGQSIWLDYIRRSLITSGELKQMVIEDGIRGVTSNPTIFEKAIAGSTDYDGTLSTELKKDPQTDASKLFETLAIEDIRMAADILRPVYDETGGADGFVSLEVSPHLAHDTKGTITEAKRLRAAVDRPNVMIKVPATPAGIPAIETLIADGVNVNVTLMFSLSHYEAVAHAYIRGLERYTEPHRVASVASFFVSRVDTMVDRALEKHGSAQAKKLFGKIAVANSKIVYRRFREIFYGEPFGRLRKRGARVQRPLWASTGTKNPAYSDVLYAEELIGTDTVNTLPPATLNAFEDHGKVRGVTVEKRLSEAESDLRHLKELGIDLDAIAQRLQTDGVAAFATSFNQLLAALEEKRKKIIAGQVGDQSLNLGRYLSRVEERRRAWQGEKFACRLWQKDPTLWSPKPVPEISDRLGWLTLPETMHEQVEDLKAFAEEVKAEGVRHVVLLGMGGSSLAPEVFQRTFNGQPDYPKLIVLDSTHPAAVRAVEAHLDLRRTLFLVSSKSGTTTETLSFFRYFWNKARQLTDHPGKQFIAITDPGTPLERLAGERGFRRVFHAPSDVGGRYSALTVFGLVPAALIGVDVDSILDRAWRMVEASAFCVSESDNPCVVLGAALGELALAGRDKVTFIASSSIKALPVWIEQLIAESTGKDGKGIVPVVDEPLGSSEVYGAERFFVYMEMSGDDSGDLEKRISALEAHDHPVARVRLFEKADLGQEFFRWEVAVAAAGAVLGIHPFNQPDVEVAKDLARKAMVAAERKAKAVQSPDLVSAAKRDELKGAIEGWLAQAKSGDYIALQAFLQPRSETTDALEQIRVVLRERKKLVTNFGYGPRFLHSTGQLHKGGANTGLFLQLVDEIEDDLEVPETNFTFGQLIRAQALGDYQALKQQGRRALRVSLGRNVAEGLEAILECLV